MKNSASIPSTIQAGAKQALQRQAQQILPVLDTLFSDMNYSEIAHQRISQQTHNSEINNSEINNSEINNSEINNSEINYQGLTRGQHPQFGQVMIKWQLSTDANQNLADLIYEAGILKSINSLSTSKNNLKSRLPVIAPPILAYENITVQILSQTQQLTILVMPYYLNGSLTTQLNVRNHSLLTLQRKHQFIVQSAQLIANLHNAGWLHNDIKPSNILLDGFMPNHADNRSIIPNLLLTDFALAEPISKSVGGSLAGTPAYLAPERWQGQGATVQSDIYAFGVMITEILVGERLFNIDSLNDEPLREWAIQHCQQTIPTLPLEYSRYQGIVDKVLAKQVHKRYQSMKEVLRDFQ